ncbi:MAG: hypothetical protein IK955_03155 [Clostridia bacterium]|nr:hypothetical protein [Clostridia bacterium]
MSTSKMLSVAPGVGINSIVNGACYNLNAQGYNCVPSIMGPTSAMIVVQKDRDGFKNFMGMGVECRVTLTLNGNMLNLNIESEWTNKVIAMVVGWFLCLIPFITGIVGAVNQNGLPGKIETAVMMSTNNPGQGMPPQGFPQNGMPGQPPMYSNNVPPQADQFGGEVPPQNF